MSTTTLLFEKLQNPLVEIRILFHPSFQGEFSTSQQCDIGEALDQIATFLYRKNQIKERTKISVEIQEVWVQFRCKEVEHQYVSQLQEEEFKAIIVFEVVDIYVNTSSDNTKES